MVSCRSHHLMDGSPRLPFNSADSSGQCDPVCNPDLHCDLSTDALNTLNSLLSSCVRSLPAMFSCLMFCQTNPLEFRWEIIQGLSAEIRQTDNVFIGPILVDERRITFHQNISLKSFLDFFGRWFHLSRRTSQWSLFQGAIYLSIRRFSWPFFLIIKEI